MIWVGYVDYIMMLFLLTQQLIWLPYRYQISFEKQLHQVGNIWEQMDLQ